jgi:hypothetical protein
MKLLFNSIPLIDSNSKAMQTWMKLPYVSIKEIVEAQNLLG